MRAIAEKILAKINAEIQRQNFNASSAIESAIYMVKFIAPMYEQLRKTIINHRFSDIEEEIYFFKKLKPDILSKYIYFSKVYHIEVKCPDGSNGCIREYLNTELDKLTYFFRNNADFYQYIRSKSTHLDSFYFTRRNIDAGILSDLESFQYDTDPLFSTGYDYKAAKIQCNKMLKSYLNNRIINLTDTECIEERKSEYRPIHFTGKKAALIELGYALASSGDINHGNIEIKELMNYLSSMFNIDLGSYYDAYIAMKERKDRTSYLNRLIESLTKRMNEDDAK